jgi:acid phosphatase
MAATASTMHAQFIISTGDNFYPSGVKSADDSQFQKTYEDVYTAPSLMVPWYVALGNHDYKGDPDAEVAYTARSTRWKMPARYYTFTVAVDDTTNAEFFVLDTSPFVEKYKTEGSYASQVTASPVAPQLHWLDSALAASKAQWKIGVGHHTIYSASPTHGNTPELIKDVVPLFEKYHVQAYLNGHDHDLQDARAAGVAFFTSGGGAESRPTGKDEHTKFSKSSTGFLAAVLDARVLHVRFLNDSGRVLYATDVKR